MGWRGGRACARAAGEVPEGKSQKGFWGVDGCANVYVYVGSLPLASLPLFVHAFVYPKFATSRLSSTAYRPKPELRTRSARERYKTAHQPTVDILSLIHI